jgi:chlorite dismutase
MSDYRSEDLRGFYIYQFWSRAPSFYGLSRSQRGRLAARFQRVLLDPPAGLRCYPYSLVGLRGEHEFVIWIWADTLAPVEDLSRHLLEGPVAPHLRLGEVRLATRRVSSYTRVEERPPPPSRKYLFVYPFVRTRAWYLLPPEERGRLMQDHILRGRQFPGVIIHTGYSFGLDDQDFYLAFECDDVGEFQSLIMTLREIPISGYTVRDTPMMVGLRRTVEELCQWIAGFSDGART